ncbi:hypothetical protein J6TS7_01060 [Paenibacillus dendritiformis]|nr:hypothetical protein J6TS7_01060 [Paenibacillus dendritiformis]
MGAFVSNLYNSIGFPNVSFSKKLAAFSFFFNPNMVPNRCCSLTCSNILDFIPNGAVTVKSFFF